MLMTDMSFLRKDCDRRIISRRELLVAMGLAAVRLPVQRGGTKRDTTPLVPPFAATGWKTVWLDHLSYRCPDYEKAAAFYVALMGWKVRSDNGTQTVLELGDNCGDIIMRSGL